MTGTMGAERSASLWSPAADAPGPSMADRAPALPQHREAIALSWVQPAGLVGLGVVNFLLRLMTLGVYHFWGKTEVRRQLWSAIRLNGEPLEYTGTGAELFRGFLVVFGLVLLPILIGSFAVAVAFGPQSAAVGLYQVSLYLVVLLLVGVATHRAQRYRLARTRWRGIRGAMAGSAWSFGWTYFWTALLVPLTLGWILPWRSTRLQARLTRDMRFGNRPLEFTARSAPLYGRFALLWFGVIAIVLGLSTGIGASIVSIVGPEQLAPGRRPDPAALVAILVIAYGGLVLGLLLYSLLSAWYRAGMLNHFAANTHLDGARFALAATARGLIWLALTNFLILLSGAVVLVALTAAILLALGLGSESPSAVMQDLGPQAMSVLLLAAIAGFGILSPVTQARTTRYLVTRLSLIGGLPVQDIAQGAADAGRRGEGLAQAFDVDAF